MLYRRLGKTNLSVSALGFGASSLGGVFREVTEDQCRRTVRIALEGGVNFVDVAPFYGLTRAETMLGKCLAGVRRDSYILATKVGRYGSSEFDFSAARVTASVDESLARLGTDYLDLIQTHDIEFGSLQQIVDETLPALRRLQQAGKVRFVGITGLPLAALRYVAQRADVDTVLSYCHYELNDTALLDLIPELQQRDIGVLSAAPLGMGLLSSCGPPAWHPAPPALKNACAAAAAHCEARGASLAELAVRFAVEETRIASTIVGTADPEEMQHNLNCLSRPLDQQLLAEVKQILAPVHNLTWPSGRAENNGEIADPGVRISE